MGAIEVLRPLGIDASSLEALRVLPLIELAWADGWPAPEALQHVLQRVDDEGMGLEAQILIQDWLRHLPSTSYLAQVRLLIPALGVLSEGALCASAAELSHADGGGSSLRRRILERWRRALGGRPDSPPPGLHPDLVRCLEPLEPPTSAGLAFDGGPRLALGPQGLTIGSGPWDQARIQDPEVAWSHCRIHGVQQRWYLEDQASRTWVNGERVTYRRLLGAEIVRISARSAFRLELPPRLAPQRRAA